jgi:O-antigen/teichoic acid export membrane protein
MRQPAADGERMSGQGMKALAVRGGLIIAFSQAARIGTQTVSVVLLSRLLSPTDFGLVASVAPFTAFAMMMQGLGLQQAVIRHKDMARDQLHRIFWLTTAISLAFAAVIVLASPALAAFYRQPALRDLAIVATLPLVVTSIGSIPAAILTRDLRFGTQAIIDCASAVLGLATAVAVAFAGGRYWSLPLGTLATSLTGLVGSWRATRFEPGWPLWALPQRELLTFGANLSGFTLVNFFARNLDKVLLGRVWGAAELGFYDRAYTLMMFPLQTINGPVAGVMIPLLSRIEADKPQLRAVYLRTVGQILLISLPGMAALTATADDVITLLFGGKWAETASIFAWLGLAGMLQPMGNSTGWLFIVQGRTDAMFRWGIYASLTTIAAFMVGLHWGAVGIACAYALSEWVLRSPVSYWYLGRIGPVRTSDFWLLQTPLFLAGAVTWLIHRTLLAGSLHGLAAIAVTTALSYALALLAVRVAPGGRERLAESLDLLGQILRLLLAGGRLRGAPAK